MGWFSSKSKSDERRALIGSNDRDNDSKNNRKSILKSAGKRASVWFGIDEEHLPDESPEARRAGVHTYGLHGDISNRRHDQSSESEDDDGPATHSARTYQYTGRQPWFHGLMSSDAAERRLQIHGLRTGLFLIRERRRYGGDHLLSLCCRGKVHHFVIEFKSWSGVALAGGRGFLDLDALVEHYSEVTEGLPCRLKYHCPRSNMAENPGGSGKRWAKQGPEVDDQSGSALPSAIKHHVKETTFSQPEPQSAPGKDDPRRSDPTAIPYQEYVPKRKKSKNGPATKTRDRDTIKRKIASLPTFQPYFIHFVTFVQVCLLAYEIGVGGLAHISMQPVEKTVEIPMGFSQTLEEVSVLEPHNFFVGPGPKFLVAHGAKYSPCMRKDTAIYARLAAEREDEEENYGCCSDNSGTRQCGLTPEVDCPTSRSNVTFSGPGTLCKVDDSTATDYCYFFNVRPCCVDIDGTCMIVTQEYCNAVNGIFHSDAQSCASVSCLASTCGMTMTDPEKPNQWWRLFTSIFLHAGVVHLVANLLLQLSLGAQIERACGWLRIGLIYMISGVGGNLFSAIFSPEIPQVGASGAVYGLLGVTIVDLFQTWQLLEHPWKRFFWVSLQIIIFLMIGTMPWIDNFAHVGGFVFGVISSMVFLPYISFGRWDKWRKRCLVFLMFPTLIVLFLIGILIFYEIQGTSFCENCKYIQCIPWTNTFCDDVY